MHISIMHAQVKKYTAHLARLTLTLSFTHTSKLYQINILITYTHIKKQYTKVTGDLAKTLAIIRK